MIIKRLKLKNIRSYLDSSISIPEGSTLLNGNIGSGKSSILLAIDFALFGLRQKELSGNGLLRNGEDSGSVELEFEIESNSIEITRNLKRSNKSVSQDTGYLSINGNKESLSAIELKERILKILGYPKSLLTKSKNLIFRYTVYTPQEEMKEILIGDSDIRVDTLRKVFGIDKYKRIKENSRILLSSLRETKREIEGKIYDLEIKLGEKIKNENEKGIIDSRLNELIPKITRIKTEILDKKEEIKQIEDKINRMNSFKKDFSVNQNSINSKEERLIKNKVEIENLSKFVLENKDFDIPDSKSILKEIEGREKKLKESEKELLELNLLVREADIRKKGSEELIKKINSLGTCPVCKQEVTENHKHSIKETENSTILSSNNKLEELSKRETKLREELIVLKGGLESLKIEHNSIQLKIFQKNRLNEKIDSKCRIEKENSDIENELKILRKKNNKIESEIKELEKIEYSSIKKEFDNLLSQERKLEIEKVGYEKDSESLINSIKNLGIEIQNKLKDKNRLNQLNKMLFFINEHFSDLMENMERKVMLKVHSDFDSLFQKWFSMLVEDEILNVKLDETFTPIIEQQGHDIDYAYLSGGERTAAALAYRLALNQTINNLITEIKTKDLIILDEPTDGFSTAQLDRMKHIIDELEAKQIILVSHDPKIESFVNNVIRFEKLNGVTRIA